MSTEEKLQAIKLEREHIRKLVSFQNTPIRKEVRIRIQAPDRQTLEKIFEIEEILMHLGGVKMDTGYSVQEKLRDWFVK